MAVLQEQLDEADQVPDQASSIAGEMEGKLTQMHHAFPTYLRQAFGKALSKDLLMHRSRGPSAPDPTINMMTVVFEPAMGSIRREPVLRFRRGIRDTMATCCGDTCDGA